ncbi:MAG: heavy metal translocating P-type ATPase [Terriglobales bacterium]
MPVAEAEVCALCGLPATGGREHLIAGQLRTFCCPGCAEVYALFDRRGMAEEFARAAEPAPDGAPPGRQLSYQIGGMWCASCAWGIAQYLRRCPGVRTATVDYASGRAEIELAADAVGAEAQIEQRIAGLGYRPLPAGAEGGEEETAGLALRTGLALFLGMGVMSLNWALYAPWLGLSTAIGPQGRGLLNAADASGAALAVGLCGWPILRMGLHGLARLAPNVDSLFSLSALAAYGLSCAAWARGGVGYFDLPAMLIAFLLAGRWIQTRARRIAQRDRDRWRPGGTAPAWRLQWPSDANAPDGAAAERVPAEALRAGDWIALRPGETVPADARLEAGWVELDESSLTGEARPVRRRAGEALMAGAQIAATGAAGNYAQVLRPAAAGLRGQIAARVEQALAARMRRQARGPFDRAARYFVPAVLASVLLALALNLWAGVDAAAAVWRAVTLLIFACPCTLGLAIPLLENRAVTQAAGQGILVQDLEGLAALSRCRTVMVDKTGTLTEGRMTVTGFAHAGGREEELLAAAAGLESAAAGGEIPADHPIAAAIRALARTRAAPPAAFTAAAAAPGQGRQGQWQGRTWRIGSAAFAAPAGAPPELAEAARRWGAEGRTLAWLSADGQPAAVFALEDPPRRGAAPALARWRRLSLWLISGDEPAAVAPLARRLGVPHWRAAATAADKAQWVTERRARGERVAVIGDGYNDAAAMAAATAAVAWARGADLPCRAAAVTLLRGDFRACERVFVLSAELRRRRWRALAWACAYNGVGMPLAAIGLIGPFGAAAAMLLSSFCSLAYVLLPFRSLRRE